MSTDDRGREGRAAVVSGGGTGIGRAIARTLAADGYRVVVVGRRREPLALVADDTGAGIVVADLSAPDEVDRAAAEIVERCGTIEALVLNAGGANRGPQETVAQVAEHWRASMAQNLLTAVLLEHALRPHLRRPGGRVVAISSAAARDAGSAAYGASKAALNRWVLGLAGELGPDGITVNAVAPGFVPDTDLYAEPVTPEGRDRFAQGIAVRRPGTPEEIADAVRWVVSPGAGFVNGTVIEVDGGRIVRRR